MESRIVLYFQLLRKLGIKRLGNVFIRNFGILWLLIEPASFFFPERLNFGLSGYVYLSLIAAAISFFEVFPRTTLSKQLSSPDSIIEIKIGDIFQQKGHLVIGFNDVFDTQLGNVIKPSSVQGQFLAHIYAGNRSQLDNDIRQALQPIYHMGIEDQHKQTGKNIRYPIGTTVTLGSHERYYFLTAYGRMGNDLIVRSNANYIWISLNQLWQEVIRKGHGSDISIPVIGAALARTGLPRMLLSKLIITSFIVASKETFIAKKLTLVIYPEDIGSINFYELEEFLTSICF